MTGTEHTSNEPNVNGLPAKLRDAVCEMESHIIELQGISACLAAVTEGRAVNGEAAAYLSGLLSACHDQLRDRWDTAWILATQAGGATVG